MRLFAACFALALLAAPAGLQAQPAPAPSCPATATLAELTRALDEAVSGPANKDRTCLRDVLLPAARMSPVRKLKDGSFEPALLTIDDWIAAVARQGDKAFYEHQVKVITEDYGHFAHLWSTYEIRDTPAGPAVTTGINSIQAVYDGKRWHVLNVLWEPDTTAGPVPGKYKP